VPWRKTISKEPLFDHLLRGNRKRYAAALGVLLHLIRKTHGKEKIKKLI
jgi:hypothetical protein